MPTYTRADGRSHGFASSPATAGGASRAAVPRGSNAITFDRSARAAIHTIPETCKHYAEHVTSRKPAARIANRTRAATNGADWSPRWLFYL